MTTNTSKMKKTKLINKYAVVKDTNSKSNGILI